MSHKDRLVRYRTKGGAADLVRVEVLVPASHRDQVVAMAGQLRSEYRQKKSVIEPLLHVAIERYRTRVLDNVDLHGLVDLRERARVVGRALQERADARGFVLGRRLVEAASG